MIRELMNDHQAKVFTILVDCQDQDNPGIIRLHRSKVQDNLQYLLFQVFHQIITYFSNYREKLERCPTTFPPWKHLLKQFPSFSVWASKRDVAVDPWSSNSEPCATCHGPSVP